MTASASPASQAIAKIAFSEVIQLPSMENITVHERCTGPHRHESPLEMDWVDLLTHSPNGGGHHRRIDPIMAQVICASLSKSHESVIETLPELKREWQRRRFSALPVLASRIAEMTGKCCPTLARLLGTLVGYGSSVVAAANSVTPFAGSSGAEATLQRCLQEAAAEPELCKNDHTNLHLAVAALVARQSVGMSEWADILNGTSRGASESLAAEDQWLKDCLRMAEEILSSCDDSEDIDLDGLWKH